LESIFHLTERPEFQQFQPGHLQPALEQQQFGNLD
jgi:hypothetical protein